jgi:hypothetical protein
VTTWPAPARGHARVLLLAALLVSPAAVAAQAVGPHPSAAGQRERTVRPVRTATPPRIDGRLTDDVWAVAARVTDFVQMAPVEGAPASEATEVYIAYDADTIYFGF